MLMSILQKLTSFFAHTFRKATPCVHDYHFASGKNLTVYFDKQKLSFKRGGYFCITCSECRDTITYTAKEKQAGVDVYHELQKRGVFKKLLKKYGKIKGTLIVSQHVDEKSPIDFKHVPTNK